MNLIDKSCILGIQKSNPKSKIYLCTDADAKDEERADEVTAALKAKELTPIYLLTGQCSRRKRDSGRWNIGEALFLLSFQSLFISINGFVSNILFY